MAVIALTVGIVMPAVSMFQGLPATRCNRCRHIPPLSMVYRQSD